MCRPCAAHGLQRRSTIQRHQPATLLYGERQQINIGDLSATQHGSPGYSLGIEQADAVRPEGVMRRRRRLGKTGRDSCRRLGMGVSRLGEDAYADVLCQRAGCPPRQGARP